MLPKIMGFAESAWAKARDWEDMPPGENRKKRVGEAWNVFANTLAVKELPKMARLNDGYNYRIPLPGAIIENGMLKANVAFPGLGIRYTTDGSEPTPKSAEYTSPVQVSGDVKLKAFDKAGRFSRTSNILQ